MQDQRPFLAWLARAGVRRAVIRKAGQEWIVDEVEFHPPDVMAGLVERERIEEDAAKAALREVVDGEQYAAQQKLARDRLMYHSS